MNVITVLPLSTYAVQMTANTCLDKISLSVALMFCFFESVIKQTFANLIPQRGSFNPHRMLPKS